MPFLSENDAENAPETELVEKCPLCGSVESEFLFWNFDRLYRLPGKFGTYACTSCDLIRISPRPTRESIGIYYPEAYGAYVTPQYSIQKVSNNNKFGIRNAVRQSVLSGLGYDTGGLSSWQRMLSPVFSRFFYEQATYGYGDRFPRFVQGGRALEVGCGNGAYLSYLKHHGWNVQGIDMSSQGASKAKEMFDIDVFVGQVEEAPFEPESIDYIHLSHVVEHFFDPLESMRTIARLLKPGGTLYMEVPNARGIGADMSAEYWYGWDAPRHLFMFSVQNARTLLERSGLSVTSVKTALWDSFAWAVTYEQEENAGKLSETRPTAHEADLKTVDQQVLEAKQQFSTNPDGGDLISCWAQKPS